MKAFLMYRDRDFDPKGPLPWNEHALVQDLELDTLFKAMALGDQFLYEVVRRAVLSGLQADLDTIRYRQHILQDCLQEPSIVRDMYAIAVEALESERKNYWSLFSRYPSAILHRSTDVLAMLVTMLRKLRNVADENAERFQSEGFRTLFAMLRRELDDGYFANVQTHLKNLKFRDGALISADLGTGNKGINYILRKPHEKKETWVQRLFGPKPLVYSFTLHPRDEAGARALSELNDKGINLVANALAQSTDHVLSFFTMLRTELAFYIGCLNLHGQLTQNGEPICFPVPAPSAERKHAFQGLYDVALSLRLDQRVVGNEAKADQKDLVIITGANQGGKSTFLRSIGMAQLMMQCGMFAPAESFSANISDGLFTHFKREEDATMKSGKLDEELSRMSEVVDHLSPYSLLLFNESFAATNEREGSEVARQIVTALIEKRVKVFFVTHLYEFAHGFNAKRMDNVLFLRAEREADGSRTFKLVEREPLQTSYGEDSYNRIFGVSRRV